MKASLIGIRRTAVAVLFALAVGAPAVGNTISGRITTLDGAPLAGVQAELWPAPVTGEDEAPAAVAVTGEDGTYVLELPEVGFWRVVLRPPHALSVQRTQPLGGGERLPPVAVPRARERWIRVTGDDGKGLAGVRVMVLTELPGFHMRPLDWQPASFLGRTGEDGGFRVTEADGARLHALASDGERSAVQLVGDDGVVRLQDAMPPARLVDAAGRPLAGRRVLLATLGFPLGRSGDGGTVSILGGEAVRSPLLVADPETGTRQRAVPQEAEDGWIVRLTPLRDLNGRVLDEDSQGVADALVQLADDVARTDEDGTFRLAASPDVPVYLRVTAAGFTPRIVAKTWGEIPDGEIQVRLRRAAELRGRVVDGDGNGLDGVSILARQGRKVMGQLRGSGDPNELREAQTDGDGSFVLRNLVASHVYSLEARRTGFGTLHTDVPPMDPGTVSKDDLVLTMRPAIRAFGQAVDASGEPLPGASIRLYTPGSRRLGDEAREVGAAVSGADGSFELLELAAGAFVLEATAAGYEDLRHPEILVEAGAGDVDLGTVALTPAEPIVGLVTDAAGQPLADVSVILVGRTLGRREAPQTTTGDDGRFSLVGPSLPADLTVHHRGFAQVGLHVTPATERQPLPGGGEGFLIVLQPATQIRGLVVDTSGQPVADASYSVELRRHNSSSTTGGGVGADGRFESPVEAGVVVVFATTPTASSRRVRLQVENGQTVDVRLELVNANVLRGRVLDVHGDGVDGIAVVAREWGDERSALANAETDADGRFVLTALPAGRLKVMAYRNRGMRSGIATATAEVVNGLEAAVELRFEDDEIPVTGQVLGADGKPAAGVVLRLDRTRDEKSRFSWGVAEAQSALDGTFELASPAPGPHTLQADGSGHAGHRESLDVPPSGVAGHVVVLRRGGEIEGTILGLTEEELRIVRVNASADGIRRGGVVQPDGTYRVRHVGEGTTMVSASLDNGPAAHGQVEVREGDVSRLDLSFDEGRRVSGRILLDGVPVLQGEVYLTCEGSSAFTRTDANGRFVLDRVPDTECSATVIDAKSTGTSFPLAPGPFDADIDLRTTRFDGRVTVAGTGDGVAGAQVELLLTGRWQHRALHTAVTDAEGRFTFPRVAVGLWSARITAPGFEDAEGQVPVTPDRPPAEIGLRPVP